ncbi:hypothetical protein JTE90_029259 [Oedothorax gibbosus]|uniref:C2H2-type domain-containing protein n=1 Tax=Oedothorax gibbosus TaxID=931172 RepID=A0AAV6TVL2_9ARAC|nr:hypothetical protein JTE90_029259 [Oedothorax gibbosus]
MMKNSSSDESISSSSDTQPLVPTQPYICKFCGDVFKHERHLREHESTHVKIDEEGFPINDWLEKFLKNTSSISENEISGTVWGMDINHCTRRILPMLVTNTAAKSFNWAGGYGKVGMKTLSKVLLLVADSTYKLLNLGLPIFFLLVKDGNAHSDIVAMGIFKNEDKETLEWFFKTFAEKNTASMRTIVAMTDKDCH